MPITDADTPACADPARLRIVLALLRAPDSTLEFSELLQSLKLTEGNLASHLRQLDRAGSVELLHNGRRGRASRTRAVLTPAGAAQIRVLYRETLARVREIADALAGGATASRVGPTRGSVPSASGPGPTAVVQPATPVLVEERYSGPD